MTFWLLVALGTAATVVYIWLSSAFRLSAGVAGSQSASDLYNARLAEIENDLAEGRIDDASAKDAVVEEGKRLLNTGKPDGVIAAGGKSGFGLVMALALVPVIAISIYMQFGNPDFPSSTSASQTVGPDKEPSIEELIAIAEQRLASHPDDVKGWKVLAPIYTRIGRFADAENAYRQIVRLEGGDAANQAALGESIFRNNGGKVTAEARRHFEQALALEPANPTANFMLGMFEFEQDRPQAAIERWQTMIDNAKGDEEWLAMVKGRIAEVKASIGGPGGEAADAIRNLPKKDQQQAIRGMVSSLAERLADDPSDKSGWLRLVRAYRVLGDEEEARNAFNRAMKLHGADPEFGKALKTQLQGIGVEEGQ